MGRPGVDPGTLAFKSAVQSVASQQWGFTPSHPVSGSEAGPSETCGNETRCDGEILTGRPTGQIRTNRIPVSFPALSIGVHQVVGVIGSPGFTVSTRLFPWGPLDGLVFVACWEGRWSSP